MLEEIVDQLINQSLDDYLNISLLRQVILEIQKGKMWITKAEEILQVGFPLSVGLNPSESVHLTKKSPAPGVHLPAWQPVPLAPVFLQRDQNTSFAQRSPKMRSMAPKTM